MIKYKLISCLLATIPIWVHLAMDIYKQKHKITINHTHSAIVAVLASFLVGLCSFDEKLQFTFFALCNHFALFNPLWNLYHHEPLNYAGDPSNSKRAITDTLWDTMSGIPWAQPFVRIIILMTGWGVYFNWDLIVNN
jgi:hypothetical protein